MTGPVARAPGSSGRVANDLDFRAVTVDEGDGVALVEAMIKEMRELYWDVGDGLDLNAPDMPKAGPAELGPPTGVFVVGYRDGVAVCGGGVKRLPDGACEASMTYASDAWMARFVLGFGSAVNVLEPQSLADKVRESAAAALHAYEVRDTDTDG